MPTVRKLKMGGQEYVVPPEELKKLGCTAEEYVREIEWLRQLEIQVLKRGEIRSPKYGNAVTYDSLRKLTDGEFYRVLTDIKNMHLIVVSNAVGFIEGVAYWLHTNPRADRLAQGLPAGGVDPDVRPEVIFTLHWDCVTPRQAGSRKDGEALIRALFEKMRKWSHSEMNTQWLRWYHMQSPVQLNSCIY